MAGAGDGRRSSAGGGATSYGDEGFSAFLRAAFLAGAGFDSDDLDRPRIGITDLTSDYNPCHRDMPQLVEHVKRGVLEAGGLPMVFPTMSLGEILLSPTSMLFRNLLAMETEELLQAQPMDADVHGTIHQSRPHPVRTSAAGEHTSVVIMPLTCVNADSPRVSRVTTGTPQVRLCGGGRIKPTGQ